LRSTGRSAASSAGGREFLDLGRHDAAARAVGDRPDLGLARADEQSRRPAGPRPCGARRARSRRASMWKPGGSLIFSRFCLTGRPWRRSAGSSASRSSASCACCPASRPRPALAREAGRRRWPSTARRRAGGAWGSVSVPSEVSWNCWWCLHGRRDGAREISANRGPLGGYPARRGAPPGAGGHDARMGLSTDASRGAPGVQNVGSCDETPRLLMSSDTSRPGSATRRQA
jgi:hypothetical protein